jgi:hypothetical protein
MVYLFCKNCSVTSHADTGCVCYKLHVMPCFKALWLISSGLRLLSFSYDSYFRFAPSSYKVCFFQFRFYIMSAKVILMLLMKSEISLVL